jgi:hypothetical protein
VGSNSRRQDVEDTIVVRAIPPTTQLCIWYPVGPGAGLAKLQGTSGAPAIAFQSCGEAQRFPTTIFQAAEDTGSSRREFPNLQRGPGSSGTRFPKWKRAAEYSGNDFQSGGVGRKPGANVSKVAEGRGIFRRSLPKLQSLPKDSGELRQSGKGVREIPDEVSKAAEPSRIFRRPLSKLQGGAEDSGPRSQSYRGCRNILGEISKAPTENVGKPVPAI